MIIRKSSLILFTTIFINTFLIFSQEWNVNYDESKVETYSLPSILTSHSGMIINNVNDWEEFRRPEILYSFTNHVYGNIPGKLDSVIVKITEHGNYLNSLAKRKQVTLTFIKNGKELSTDLLIYLPNSIKKAPVFLGYNFQGNHTVIDDKNIFITKSWVPANEALGVTSNQATEKSRGEMSRRWSVEKIINAGYGLVTLYRGDIDPDKDDFSDGIHQLFYLKDQKKPEADEWGTIAAWSWGLSRVMDYIEADEDIDHEKVIVFGHSRLGKAALWAAATDKRFAGCISNNSGEMGAALSKRNFGETIEVINTAFPHWFCGNFKKYSKKEYMLPVDQHMLISLIAPRPVYIASATDDLWADPKGEFLSAKEASVAYNLYGISGLITTTMPQPDSPIIGVVSYHLRTGVHDVTDYDWEQYIKFAKFNNF